MTENGFCPQIKNLVTGIEDVSRMDSSFHTGLHINRVDVSYFPVYSAFLFTQENTTPVNADEQQSEYLSRRTTLKPRLPDPRDPLRPRLDIFIYRRFPIIHTSFTVDKASHTHSHVTAAKKNKKKKNKRKKQYVWNLRRNNSSWQLLLFSVRPACPCMCTSSVLLYRNSYGSIETLF